MTGFAELFAAAHDVRVLVPTHPGFGGTPRPEALGSIPGLAALYNTLLDRLDLQDVTVIGNSIGGWITAEIALLKSPRVSGIVLIDAVGIEVPGHPVADFFALTMDQVFARSFHNPEPFRIDPATLPPAAQAVAAGNRAAIAAYAGASMADPTLAGRLATLEIPDPGAVGRERPDRRCRLRTRLRRRDPHGPVPAAARHRPLPAAGDPRPGYPRDLGQRYPQPAAPASDTRRPPACDHSRKGPRRWLFWLVPPNRRAESVEGYYLDFTRPACEAVKSQGVKRVVAVSTLGRGVAKNAGQLPSRRTGWAACPGNLQPCHSR